MAESRRRGETFDEAWSLALGAPSSRRTGVRFPHATQDRHVWLAAFESTRVEWQACYERMETALSRALVELQSVGIEDFSAAARLASLVAADSREVPRMAGAPVQLASASGRSGPSGELQWPETREIAA